MSQDFRSMLSQPLCTGGVHWLNDCDRRVELPFLPPPPFALGGYIPTRKPSNEEVYTPKKILRSSIVTIVFWKDGTKTIVRCPVGKKYDEYEAFTAALAIKIFGNNSHLKKVIKHTFSEQKSKKGSE